jgi:predicted amidophosphoribosyltransferase
MKIILCTDFATRDNTVTPVYAHPFTHESPNAFSQYLFKFLGQKNCAKTLIHDLYALTLNQLTTTIVAPPSNVSKWQMGFNSAFKGLNNI